MNKKTISKILSIALSFSLAISPIANSEVKASNIINKKFNLAHPVEHTVEFTSSYYYTDDYFNQSSYVYNPSLATMSICMASAAIGCNKGYNPNVERNYSIATNNLKQILTEIGYDSFYANEDYTKKPTPETSGIAFAKKKVTINKKDCTIIAINFRGGLYEREWVKNFQIGDDNFHSAFKEDGEKTLALLDEYVAKNNITGDIKIWISSYSKSAGIANYVAHQLDDYHFIENVNFTAQDVFSYAFATPRTTKSLDYKKAVFKNIYNILSPYDVVTTIPTEQWGWHRYGTEIYLPKYSDDSYAAKKERAQKFLDLMAKNTPVVADILPEYSFDISDTSNPKIIPTGNNKEVSDILDDLTTALSIVLESEERIATLYPAIYEAIDSLTDATPSEMNIIKNYIMGEINKEGLQSIIFDIIISGDKAPQILIDALKAAGKEVEDEAEVKAALTMALTSIVGTVLYDVDHIPGDAASIYLNVNPFIGNHCTFTYLAWMQSMDSNYKLASDYPVVPTKPGKGKVKSATKSGSKIKVKLKKILKSKGYQIKVYSSKKNAKKNKKAIYSKYVKKTSFSINSKKFKKKSKLYVKVRAYKVTDTKKKLYGKWSAAKKVKISKKSKKSKKTKKSK